MSTLLEDDLFHLFVSCLCLPLIIRFAWATSYLQREERWHGHVDDQQQSPIEQRTSTIDDDEYHELDDEQPIELILKFLNETQRSIVVHSNDTIRKLKRFFLSLSSRFVDFFQLVQRFVSDCISPMN